jgi:hypothetical protein
MVGFMMIQKKEGETYNQFLCYLIRLLEVMVPRDGFDSQICRDLTRTPLIMIIMIEGGIAKLVRLHTPHLS